MAERAKRQRTSPVSYNIRAFFDDALGFDFEEKARYTEEEESIKRAKTLIKKRTAPAKPEVIDLTVYVHRPGKFQSQFPLLSMTGMDEFILDTIIHYLDLPSRLALRQTAKGFGPFIDRHIKTELTVYRSLSFDKRIDFSGLVCAGYPTRVARVVAQQPSSQVALAIRIATAGAVKDTDEWYEVFLAHLHACNVGAVCRVLKMDIGAKMVDILPIIMKYTKKTAELELLDTRLRIVERTLWDRLQPTWPSKKVLIDYICGKVELPVYNGPVF